MQGPGAPRPFPSHGSVCVPSGVNAGTLGLLPPGEPCPLQTHCWQQTTLVARSPGVGSNGSCCRGHTPHLSVPSGTTSPSFANRWAGPAFPKHGMGAASVAVGSPTAQTPRAFTGQRWGWGPFQASPDSVYKPFFLRRQASFHVNSRKHLRHTRQKGLRAPVLCGVEPDTDWSPF